jgi:mannose-6-phosphate isomerase-like protein (cupin superfamily)
MSQSPRPFLVRPEEVVPFCLPGHETVYQSRALIAPDGAGSKDLLVNHFTVKVGQGMTKHVHPVNDELYYVLAGNGYVELGGAPGLFDEVRYPVEPDSAVFIPAGTYHRLQNEGGQDLVLLTIWPRQPEPGSNPIYDARLENWGCTFRSVDETAGK